MTYNVFSGTLNPTHATTAAAAAAVSSDGLVMIAAVSDGLMMI